MTTAQNIIDRAMRLIGALESGESATADETADGLLALNAMLDSWRNQRLLTYSLTEKTLPLVGGDGSYSIGSSGDVDTTRPVKLLSAFRRSNGVDYPVRVVDKARYDAISDKSAQGDVSLVYYDPAMASGVLTVWPVPSSADVLHLTLMEPLLTLATAGTSVTLPPGYERALAFNLALDIAPEYGKEPSATVHSTATASLSAVKRANSRQIVAYSEHTIGRVSSGL